MKTIALSLALAALTVTPTFADHNNPWATETDTILSKNHDANQERSVGTPGEDEMNGKSAGNADAGPQSGVGHGGGQDTASAGRGGAGNGGAGNGGSGHGQGAGGKGRDS